MTSVEDCGFTDIDGLRIRIRKRAHDRTLPEPAAPEPVPQANAEALQQSPGDGWKDFVEPHLWQQVEGAMHRVAYGKQLASRALRMLSVTDKEPDHVKMIALHQLILHEAAKDMKDPAVAKVLINIERDYRTKMAAQRAEQDAMPGGEPLAGLYSKARERKQALTERLQELKEQTAFYQGMHKQLLELNQSNAELKESLAKSAHTRAAIEEKRAMEQEVNDQSAAQMVRPQFTICSTPHQSSIPPQKMKIRCVTQVEELAQVNKRADKTIWASQAARKAMDVCLHLLCIPVSCNASSFPILLCSEGVELFLTYSSVLQAWFSEKQMQRFPLDPRVTIASPSATLG
jgi:hypothetical protein